MTRQMYLAHFGMFAGLMLFFPVSVLGQQSDTATSSTPSSNVPPQKVPYSPPLIRLNEHPRGERRDPMNVVNATQQHAAPLAEDASIPLPEMVPDGKGGMAIAHAKETFSNLTLEGSELKAVEPVFGGREEKPSFIRELWQLRWRPNDPIDLYIILPRNVNKPPVSLYLYSFPADTDRFKNDRYCERVTHNGVAAIGFVSALTGQRYAFRPFKEWFVSELPESLASSVHDVQMILKQLQTRQDLDMSRIGMFGQGSGGAIAILAAAVDPRIQVVDVLDPWGDWPDWFAKSDAFPEEERAAYLNPEFQKRLEPLEPLKYLPSLKDRKVRLLFMKENGEPEEAVKKLVSTSPANAEIRQYRTNQDEFRDFSGGRLFSWMAEQLGAQVAPRTPSEAAQIDGAKAPVQKQK